MKKIWALLLLVSLSALAVDTKKDACEPFVKKLCAEQKTLFAVSKCLVAKGKELDPACKAQVSNSLEKSHPCSMSILNFCPNATDLNVNSNIECLTKNSFNTPTSCQKYLKGRGDLIKASTNEFTQACSSEYAKLCPGLKESALTDCMHKAYVGNKVEGQCKVIMDKYAAMRKKKPSAKR